MKREQTKVRILCFVGFFVSITAYGQSNIAHPSKAEAVTHLHTQIPLEVIQKVLPDDTPNERIARVYEIQDAARAMRRLATAMLPSEKKLEQVAGNTASNTLRASGLNGSFQNSENTNQIIEQHRRMASSIVTFPVPTSQKLIENSASKKNEKLISSAEKIDEVDANLAKKINLLGAKVDQLQNAGDEKSAHIAAKALIEQIDAFESASTPKVLREFTNGWPLAPRPKPIQLTKLQIAKMQEMKKKYDASLPPAPQ